MGQQKAPQSKRVLQRRPEAAIPDDRRILDLVVDAALILLPFFLVKRKFKAYVWLENVWKERATRKGSPSTSSVGGSSRSFIIVFISLGVLQPRLRGKIIDG